MDTATSHILHKLDEVLDLQRQLLARQSPKGSGSEPIRALKWPKFSGAIVQGAMAWAIVVCVQSYIAHGGDILKLIEAFSKFFGSMPGGSG
jgi:hypothetical protein